jgi:hypothetical protein
MGIERQTCVANMLFYYIWQLVIKTMGSKVSFYLPCAMLMFFFKKKKLKASELQRRYDMIAL